MGIVPNELLGFIELFGFEKRLGFVRFDFIGKDGVECMASESW